jgi:hypothetical protein
MIYNLLLISDTSISISSPRKKTHPKKQQRRVHSASLLLVNRQIHDEASAIFFSSNAFIIGNGFWGSTNQANVHALKLFIKTVPKSTIALIRKLELDVTCTNMRSRGFGVRKQEVELLVAVCHCIVKYFTGVREVLVGAIPQHLYSAEWSRFLPNRKTLEENFNDVAKALRILLASSALKKINFNIESACNIRVWADAVLDGKPEDKAKVGLWGNEGHFPRV